MQARLRASGLADLDAKLLAGERLTMDDGVRLFEAPDLLAVGWLANREREKRHEARTYFNYNLRLEPTNVCTSSCLFCSFARLKPTDEHAYTMSLEQAWDKLRSRANQPITELHIVNGLNPDLPFDYYTELLRGFKRIRPEIHLKCFTAVEIAFFADLYRMTDEQVLRELKAAGLDFYNHNIDTSEEFYGEIITTRCFQDRLDTLKNVQDAGIKVCCGGIVGLGEARRDRAAMLTTLATMTPHPESVPINMLVAIPGTPLEGRPNLEPIEFVRTIAVARILMPGAFVRLSAGREAMSDEMQALCFLAGANSAFLGDKLLTAPNPEFEHDHKLFAKLGIGFLPPEPAAKHEAAE
mgnify:CR=1 FL=1